MLVDSITKSVNSKRFNNKHKTLLELYTNQTELYECVLVINKLAAHAINIQVHKDKDKPDFKWCLHQTEFFKLSDMLALSVLNLTSCDPALNDLKCFRPSLAGTKHSTLTLNKMFCMIGITDENSYINNFENVICFNADSIKRLVKLTYSIIINN